MKTTLQKQLAILTFACCMAVPFAKVQAASSTWTGATNGQWGTNTNWAGNVLPAFNGTEDIVIPSTGVTTTSMTFGAVRDVKTLSIQLDGGVFSAVSGQALKMESGLSMNAGTASNKNFYSDGTLAMGANNTWDIAQNNYLRTRTIDFGSGYTLTKTGLGTVVVNDLPMAGTGSMAVNGGTMDLIADFSTVLTSISIDNQGTVNVDNPQSNKNNRFSDTMPVTMGRGTFLFQGRNGNVSSETIGALTVANGVGAVQLQPNSATSTTLTIASYTRGANGWVNFGTTTGTLGGSGASPMFIKFTTAPTLSDGIIPYASLDADLATYDGTNGVVVATYQATTLAGISAATDNVKISANETLLADKTVNALVVAAPGGTYGNGMNLGGKTLTITSGNLVLGNDLNQVNNGTIAFGSAAGFIYGRSRNILENGITGSGGLTYGGDVTLNNVTMGYTGDTNIVGTLTFGLANSNKIPDASAVTIALGGQIIQDGRLNLNETVGSLAGAGTINITPNTGNATTLFAGGNNTSTIFSGAMKGSFSFTKQGSGTFTFSGSSTTTGTTTVSAGTMLVNGSISGATTVATGGTLGGSGTLGNVTVSVGGTLSPGNSPGLLTVAGTLTLGGNTLMEIATGTRGVNFDGVNIGDGQLLTYGGSLTLTMAGAIVNGTYDLFSSVTTATALNKTGNFSSIAFAGFYSGGTFNRVGDLWTSSVTNGQIFTFDQSTGDLVAAVPEPSTWLLLAFGLTVVVTLRRRRSA